MTEREEELAMAVIDLANLAYQHGREELSPWSQQWQKLESRILVLAAQAAPTQAPDHDGLLAAHRTLERLGYTWYGGELWKPPLGQPPRFAQAAPTQAPAQPVAPTYVDDNGVERPERRKRDRGNDDERIAHIFCGFANMIDNADDYSAGYLRAMRQEFADLLAAQAAPSAPEVRLDGTVLDELVGVGHFHLENMDANVWWMELSNEAGGVAVWLRARGAITAYYERRPPYAAPPASGQQEPQR